MGFLNNTDPRERAVNQQIQQTHNQINELYLDLGRYVKLNLKDKIDDQYVRNAAQNIEHWLRKCNRMFRIGKLNLSKPLVWIFSLAYHTHKLIVSIE